MKKESTIRIRTLTTAVLAVLYVLLLAGFFYYHSQTTKQANALEAQNNSLVDQWHQTLQDNQKLINRVDILENKDGDYSKLFKDNRNIN